VKTFLEPEEIYQLSQCATNLRDRLLIHLLFRLGCRISEALAITLDDIDFVKSTVNIQHLKTRLNLSCSNCKAQLARNHGYCPKCGAKVAQAVAEARESADEDITYRR
jgi:integrase/recombinase XerD